MCHEGYDSFILGTMVCVSYMCHNEFYDMHYVSTYGVSDMCHNEFYDMHYLDYVLCVIMNFYNEKSIDIIFQWKIQKFIMTLVL